MGNTDTDELSILCETKAKAESWEAAVLAAVRQGNGTEDPDQAQIVAQGLKVTSI